MSVKNPLAPLTEEHGLKRCSMNRCCNVERFIELKEELKKAKKALRVYSEMKIEGYPHLGDAARRFLNDQNNN